MALSRGGKFAKSVDKAFAVKGEVLTYTVTFTNDGNIPIQDIYFTDEIPQGTTFTLPATKFALPGCRAVNKLFKSFAAEVLVRVTVTRAFSPARTVVLSVRISFKTE